MEKIDIPRKAVYRLSLYLRCLEKLQEKKEETVSSEALAKAAGVKSTQLRKDLGYIGQFGTRGLGYNVDILAKAITGVMGSTRLQPVVLVGVGTLGAAMLQYSGFKREGFEIIAAFDQSNDVIAQRTDASPVPIYHSDQMVDYIRSHDVKMTILAVPGNYGQQVANALVEAGVEAILNFSPVVLQVPDHVVVNHVDLAAELESLSYFVK
ncbi:MAG: redox-sensing transcriptional repressor Rex [Verrucomicrobiota bacterium]